MIAALSGSENEQIRKYLEHLLENSKSPELLRTQAAMYLNPGNKIADATSIIPKIRNLTMLFILAVLLVLLFTQIMALPIIDGHSTLIREVAKVSNNHAVSLVCKPVYF